jgi:hypothetical protein
MATEDSRRCFFRSRSGNRQSNIQMPNGRRSSAARTACGKMPSSRQNSNCPSKLWEKGWVLVGETTASNHYGNSVRKKCEAIAFPLLYYTLIFECSFSSQNELFRSAIVCIIWLPPPRYTKQKFGNGLPEWARWSPHGLAIALLLLFFFFLFLLILFTYFRKFPNTGVKMSAFALLALARPWKSYCILRSFNYFLPIVVPRPIWRLPANIWAVYGCWFVRR